VALLSATSTPSPHPLPPHGDPVVRRGTRRRRPRRPRAVAIGLPWPWPGGGSSAGGLYRRALVAPSRRRKRRRIEIEILSSRPGADLNHRGRPHIGDGSGADRGVGPGAARRVIVLNKRRSSRSTTRRGHGGLRKGPGGAGRRRHASPGDHPARHAPHLGQAAARNADPEETARHRRRATSQDEWQHLPPARRVVEHNYIPGSALDR
jgi:hypothetical protein